MKYLIHILMVIVLFSTLLVPLPGQAEGLSQPESRGTVHAARRGNPWLNLDDGQTLPVDYDGPQSPVRALGSNQARPLALTADDFDADGVPDLLAAYATSGGGLLALHRGNVDSIYPNAPEAQQRRAGGAFTGDPFLSSARTFELPAAPDFLGAGDFDNDGHRDVVLAARGGSALYLLPGDGRGGFGPAQATELPGTVTALAVGEVNRHDGLADVVVGVAGPAVSQVLIFEGAEGALRAAPEMFAAPAEVGHLILGQLDDDYFSDVAFVAGDDLHIVHGRDRKLSYHERERAGVPAAIVDHHTLSFTAAKMALGNFVAEPGSEHRLELAFLTDDGAVHFLDAATVAESNSFPISSQHRSRGEVFSGGQLLRIKSSSLLADDLLVLDPTNQQLHILNAQFSIANDQTSTLTSLDVAGAPTAALPMRLNADALDDLVILGEEGLAVSLTAPMSTFTVDSASDDSDANLGDDACATSSGECTLRAAIEQANASPGADAIDFLVTAITAHDLPHIVDALTIDGTLSGMVELNGSGSTAFSPHGLDLFEGGPCVVRGMVINRFAHGAAIRVGGQTGGHIVEGNYLGTDVLGSSPQGNHIGIQVGSASNHTLGGTTEAARNVISGNGMGIWLENTSGTVVQGNYIGTDSLGLINLGNEGHGLLLGMGDSNIIGGIATEAGNFIAGNAGTGIQIHTNSNLIQGNWIGIDRHFTAMGNHGAGVQFVGACRDNTVGGTAAGAGTGNVIAANELAGIEVGYSSGGVRDNLIRGNVIGTDLPGDAFLGNGLSGVAVYARDLNAARIFSNTIAYNGSNGVWVDDDAHSPIAIQNSIFQNGGLGIDLYPHGPTPNDPGDWDEGANNGQNWPEISAIAIGETHTQVTFEVDTWPANAAYPLLIEFFLADSPTSDAEGRTYLGEVYYFESDAQSSVTRSFEPVARLGAHSRIVATATDAEGNTSEFSRPTSSAGDLVVNSTGDADDSPLFDGVCDTGYVLPGGEAECTLRAAIQTANLDPGAVMITFDIEGAQGTPTIQPGSPLPDIASWVGIDGTTQPGSGMVELDGRNAGAGADGLHITAGNSHVTGLVINRFAGAGIHLEFGGYSVIQGNYIGTDVTGSATPGNKGAGVWIEDSESNIIGGVSAEQRNVISGNEGGGVLIWEDGARRNQVQGNYIGTDVTGEKELGNGDNGVNIFRGFHNVIGGTDDGAGNVIAGSEDCGVEIWGGFSGELAANNQVLNNYIGTNRNNSYCLSPASDLHLGNRKGVCLTEADVNTIGTSASGNVIGCNTSYGVYLERSNRNTVTGNHIGVDASGQAWLSNGLDGVYLEDASNNTIQDNVISGNGSAASYDPNNRNGIRIRNSQFAGATASKNVVVTNIIGLDVDEDTALGNQGSGLLIEHADHTRIENNVIAANEDHGLEIKGSGAVGTVVLGNSIGRWANGQDAELRNFGHGILVLDVPQMRIADNVISGNNLDGISLRGPGARGIRIEGNLIGVDQVGWTDLGNGNNGISLHSTGYTTIKDNVVAGNDHDGIVIDAVGDGMVSANYIGTYRVGARDLRNEWVGLDILSDNWRIMGNRVWFNCTNIQDLGQDNVYENNSLRKGSCTSTGFFCDGCTATLTGNEIAEDVGDGIKCANGASPTIYGNNILDNVGYGLHNLDSNVTVAAQQNWWGAADGPGGVGSGSGDGVSDHVDYANWRGESVSLVASVADDPLLAAPGATVSTTLFFQNWANLTDTFDVTLVDSRGGRLPPMTATVTLSESLGAAMEVSFTLPPGGTLIGVPNTVTVTATSQADPSDVVTVTFQVMSVESADLAVIQTVSTDTGALNQQLRYTLTISNAGPTAATGVVVTDTLPEEVALVSADASQGDCGEQPSTVVCDLGTLGIGAEVTVTVAVTLTEHPADGGEIVNYARVSGDQYDLVSWNDVYALYTLAETRFHVYLPLVVRRAGQ